MIVTKVIVNLNRNQYNFVNQDSGCRIVGFTQDCKIRIKYLESQGSIQNLDGAGLHLAFH